MADLPEQRFVGQAPLAVFARSALAVDERIPLGMALAVDRRGQNAVEGVHPQPADKHLARLFQPEPKAIQLVGVAVALRLPIAEGRRLRPTGNPRHDHRGLLGRTPGVLREIVAVEMPPQQVGHTQHDALVAAAPDAQRAGVAGDFKAVFTGLVGVSAQKDVAMSRPRGANHGQTVVAHAVDEGVEQAGGLASGLRGVGQDDSGTGLVPHGEGHLGLSGNDGQGRQRKDEQSLDFHDGDFMGKTDGQACLPTGQI